MKLQFTKKDMLMHLFFVSLFLIVPTLAFVRPPGEPFMFLSRVFVQDTIANFVLLCFFYLNYYVLLPQFFLREKYLLYILSIIGFFSVMLTLPHLGGKHLPFIEHNLPPEHFENFAPHKEFALVSFVFDEFRRHLFLFFTALFFAFLLRTREHLSALKEEKMKAELSSLKSQINPHFLFNTLNSIYALVIKKDDRAADAIINLSGLMRYAIKDAHDYKIPLVKELEYISNYIELQQSRIGNTATVIFNCAGNQNNKEIAPLILITYIENAFKYGINPDVGNSVVEVNIDISNDSIAMQVFNKKVHLENVINSTNIGMKNTLERLDMIYPQKHTIAIDENDYSYTVNLTIKLV